MHVVLVMDQYDSQANGTTVTARRLAENLRDFGHEVTILAGGQPEDGKICAKKKHIPFFQILIESQGMCFAKPDKKLYYEAFKDADIVHFFMPFGFCRKGAKFAREMKKPCVAGFHIQPENITSTLFLNKSARINRGLYRWFNNIFYHDFEHIHCPSQLIADQLEENGYTAQTHVISNGVSRSFQKVSAERPEEWQGKFVILMVGRYSREKRQDLLIEAAAQSRYADRIQLVFAGKGPTRGHYARLGKKLANQPIMKFMSQDELLRTMNQCDLYVHASDAEAEGISALEAMACGLVPVISDSRLSATGQYVLCEESLFAAGDAADLAGKIDYWIEHPVRKMEMSEQYAAQQEANRVDVCAQRMVEVYRQVIGEHQAHSVKVEPRHRRILTPNPEKLDSRVAAASLYHRAFTRFWAGLAGIILAPLEWLFLGLRVEGRENLKSLPGGAVAVCNHVHMMDSTMVKLALRDRHLWVVSLRENFEMPVIGWLVKGLGAVPLETSVRSRIALNGHLKRNIAQGDTVLYFPEGMLVPYYDGLRPMWGGAFDLAVQADCPVLPLVICPRERRGLYRLKRKPCLTIKVLPPVVAVPAKSAKAAREVLLQRTETVMQRALADTHLQMYKKTQAEPQQLNGRMDDEPLAGEWAV